MSASSQYGRFGSGKAVPRVEDASLLMGAGRFVDDHNAEGQAHVLFLRSPHAHARIVGIDKAGAAAMPGVVADRHRPGSRPRRREAAADLRGLPPRRRCADGGAAAPCARGRYRALRGRGRRRGRREFARGSAGRAGSHRRALRPAAERRRFRRGRRSRRRTGMGGGHREHRGGDSPWRCRRDGEGLRECRARRCAGSRQSAAGAVPHRAARLARELRHRERTHHAPREQPDADRTARHVVRRGARHRARQGAGARGRRRRRLRDEDGAVSGGRRAGVLRARLETAAQVVRRAHRRVSRGFPRPRREQQGRVGAGCVRPGAGAPRVLARQPGCVRDARRRRDPAAHRTVGVDEHLRHSAHRHRHQGRAHEYEPDGRLPRRRTSRGHLPHRTPDGRGRAKARHGSGRAPAAQHDSARADAVQESDGQDLRQRQLRVGPGSGARARRLERIRSAARGVGPRRKLRGRGMAAFLEWTGADVFEEQVTVTVAADGYVEIFSATQAMGQGLATTFAQLAVDVFDVPIEKIRIVQGDTDRGTGFGSAGSRSLFVGGSAVQVAAQRTVQKAQDLAAAALEAAATDIEYAERRVHRRGHRSAHRPLRSGATAAGAADPAGLGQLRRRTDVAERLPHLRSRDRSRHGSRADRRLLVGERRRPRRESAHRDRTARRRRRAGDRAGAVREFRL